MGGGYGVARREGGGRVGGDEVGFVRGGRARAG